MKKVILFGATGNLGKAIAQELINQKYDLTVVVRNRKKAEEMAEITINHIVADISDNEALADICEGYDVVISALGKSVSPFERSKPSFQQIDFDANTSILREAIKGKVPKFVYISALHSEKYPELEYFRVHHQFSQQLISSGINYSIIKPPAIFSAFKDMIYMARNNLLVNLGKGDKLTNPIFEGDLAKIAVDSIASENQVIEAGGKNIYSRRQLNEIILRKIKPGSKLRSVPLTLVKISLPLMKIADRNAYDKMAFFVEVLQHDTIAPQTGEMSFEEYVALQEKG